MSSPGTLRSPTHSPLRRGLASYGVVLALTTTATSAAAAGVSSLLVLGRHPPGGYAFLAGLINQQNQGAKTAAYVLAFAVILPVALLIVPRLADRLASGPGSAALPAAAALISGALAGVVIVVRLTSKAGGGLAVLLAGLAVWGLLTGGVLVGLSRAPRGHRLIAVLSGATPRAWSATGVLVLLAVLSLTRVHSLRLAGLLAGAGAALGVGALALRGPRPRIGLRTGLALDALVGPAIALAVVDVVVYLPSPGPPNFLAMPGIVQSQHDYFLGPINQLLHHGALLVNAPGSQYGVGDLYLIAAWSHLVAIGYGSFAMLDGLLSALFYIAAYAVLRLAGLGRALAALALAFAICVFVYHFQYPVGVLPEMGPLRFGLPILVLLGALIAARGPGWRRAGRTLELATVGVASVWSVETLVYCLGTWAGVSALELYLVAARTRWGWTLRRLGAVAGAVVLAHSLFAAATLAGSGSLPHWGQYLAYVNSFLLGGKAGEVTYGFDRWSPALALGALLLALASAAVLLAWREPESVRAQPGRFLAFGGSVAYAIVLFSYTDNRSSTYLLPYLALPALLAVTIGLDWLRCVDADRRRRHGMAILAAGVAVVMVGAAWPTIGARFSASALAKARPGGGLLGAARRLAHSPAIDPRTASGVRLLRADFPAGSAAVILSDAPDLAIEILMHADRANTISIGDTGMDSYVPSDWTGRIGGDLAALRPGARVLTDAATLTLAATVATRPGLDPLERPLVLGGNQMEWILQRLQMRFALVPIRRDTGGLIVAVLRAR